MALEKRSLIWFLALKKKKKRVSSATTQIKSKLSVIPLIISLPSVENGTIQLLFFVHLSATKKNYHCFQTTKRTEILQIAF